MKEDKNPYVQRYKDQGKKDILETLPVRMLKTRDCRIAYRELGTGYPLVLIMGVGGTMYEWDRIFLTLLAKQFRVIIFDNRGTGDSTGADTRYRISDLADDTQALIRGIGIKKAHVFGYSLGSMIALQLYEKDPALISSLILYATARSGKETVERLLPYVDPKTPEVVSIDALFPAEWIATHPDLMAILPPPAHPINGPAILYQIEITKQWEISRSFLSSILIPVLVLVGSNDSITPPEAAQEIAQAIPGSSLVVLPGGGHAVMYQEPEMMARLVLDFVPDI